MAKKPTKLPVDVSLLTEEDRAALKKSARESILEQMKQEARDAYFADQMEHLRRAQIPQDQIVPVTVELAPFASHLLIDGVPFWHGCNYTVPAKQAAVLYEQMQRSWQHQDEIDGRSKFNPYRRPQNAYLGRGDIGRPTVGTNGRVEAEI